MRRAAWVCKLLGTLEGRCFWNPGLLFGFSWQSGCRAHLNARGTARSGRGQPGMPSLGSWVQHQSSLGHSEPTPKGPGVSWWEPAASRVAQAGPWHRWLRKSKPGRLPLPSCPPHASNVARYLGGGARSLHWPSRYVNESREMSS